MKIPSLQHLLHTHISGNLSKDEYLELKHSVDEIIDESLEEYLYAEWNEYVPVGTNEPASKNIYNRISGMNHNNARTGRKIPYKTLSGIAAMFIVVLAIGILYLWKDNNHYRAMVDNKFIISTGKGERSSVKLPDGTRIYLNSRSTLRYDASFSEKQRMVSLSGEAYFEVAHNPGLPFIVKTPLAKIKVLGTVFNISAYPRQDFFETTLVNGSVEITPTTGYPSEKMILTPHQKAHFNKWDQQWIVSTTDLWVETAWRHGNLTFRSKNIQQVIRGVEDYYGVRFSIRGNYPGGLFTGSFRDEPVTNVLLNLQQYYRFTYSKSGNDVQIKFK